MAALMDSDTPVHKANKHSGNAGNGEHLSESDSDRTHTGACVQSEEAASAARPHYEDDALQAVFVRRCQSRKLLPLLPMAKKVHQENSIQRFDQLSLHSVADESDAWLSVHSILYARGKTKGDQDHVGVVVTVVNWK